VKSNFVDLFAVNFKNEQIL